MHIPAVSPYVAQLNAFKAANNELLVRSAYASSSTLSAPAYAFGSEAAQWSSLGQTIADLKSAWQSGLYGAHRYATVGTTINTLA
ncbi:MAG: hypothetical protein NVS9B12_09550 [Vulcanimicrobiaceae bacterium]